MDIKSRFYAKLYPKEEIATWNLPVNMKEQIQLDNFDYFFLVSTIEKDSEENHVHFSVYPIQENTVHLFQIQAKRIVPKLLTTALTFIKEAGFCIISSTGICTDLSHCYFGVFTSIDCSFELDGILSKLKKLEGVDSIKVYNFTCEGCCELTST